MSDDDRSVRKRFFVNGEASAALDMHGRYLKPARRLLAQVRAGQLVQQQTELDHEPELVATTLHGDITRRHYVGGATLRATRKGGLDEVSIDVHSHTVDEQPSGGIKPQPLPYLWVGARIKEEYTFGPGASSSDYDLILGVWEPDHKDGRHRGIVCSNPPVRAIEHVTPVAWDGLMGTESSDPRNRPSRAGVTLTEDGLYMASSAWNANGAEPTSIGRVLDWCLQAPFDPMRKDTAAEQTRVDTYFGINYALWTHVAVLDAWPQVAPTDGRPLLQIPQALRALRITPTVLAGQYVVKVGLNYVACFPVTVEIEVHLNKQPHTIVQRFEVTITHGGGSYFRLIHPYGAPTDWIHGCDYEVGNNPHWRNWWAGALLVDVLGGGIKPVPYHVPTHGFEPGAWSVSLEGCGLLTPTVRVLYFALQFPFSNAWMGAYKAQVLAVTESAFDANPQTQSTGIEAVWGRASEYPVSPTNSYWRTEGNPPQIPDPLAIRIQVAELHGVNEGVVYQVVCDFRLDWPFRFSITSKPSMNSQTLAGDPFAYQADMIATANALEATSLHVTVPGAHFNPIDLGGSSQCITPGDTRTDGSPAVEVEPT